MAILIFEMPSTSLAGNIILV